MVEDRIYVDRGLDAGTAALLTQHGNGFGNDPWAAMAMMNGGMGGMNAMWNNPMMYLVWLAVLGRGGFGGYGYGNEGNGCGCCDCIQSQLASIQSTMADNQNTGLLMDAIKGNASVIGDLATSLNCDFNALNSGICAVQSAIQNVAAQTGFSAERIINAVNQGDCGVIQAIKDCCCNTQQSILKMGYENQLANCNQTNTLIGAINGVNTGLERGFSSVAYETQSQTCQLLKAGQDNTQRIVDVLNSHWNQELQQKYDSARLELSQLRQNAVLIEALRPTTTATA